jgi:hypothetical protein
VGQHGILKLESTFDTYVKDVKTLEGNCLTQLRTYKPMIMQ